MSEPVKPRPGWVYVLTNNHPSMRGLVKIGMTQRCPSGRAAELAGGSGIPSPFIVTWCIPVSDCRYVETTTHRMLADKRVMKRREFFAVDVDTAKQTILAAAGSLVIRKRFWKRTALKTLNLRSRRASKFRTRNSPGYVLAIQLATATVIAIALFRPRVPLSLPWPVADTIRFIEALGQHATKYWN